MTDKPEDTRKFIIRERDGNASLWVGKLNIWDIPHKHATPDVLGAILSAYNRGREMVIEELRESIHEVYLSSYGVRDWVDERTIAP